jgi:putative chitobiose transport system permease protein
MRARRLRRASLTALGGLTTLLFMLPLWWTVASALRPEDEAFAALSPVSLWTLVPQQLTLGNFTKLIEDGFLTPLVNSAIVAGATVVIGLFISATAAFALAILRFPGRGALFAVMVVSFLIPFDAIAIPLAEMFRAVRLQNTYWGLILPGVANGFAVFLLRQFFLGIPSDLADAGRVDGLGWWGVFRRIYLPLSRPALVSAGLILFVFQWQAYLWPLIIAPEREMRVAPVAIAEFSAQYDVDFGLTFAASVLTMLVPLVVLLFFQRYFIRSLAMAGTKG